MGIDATTEFEVCVLKLMLQPEGGISRNIFRRYHSGHHRGAVGLIYVHILDIFPLFLFFLIYLSHLQSEQSPTLIALGQYPGNLAGEVTNPSHEGRTPLVRRKIDGFKDSFILQNDLGNKSMRFTSWSFNINAQKKIVILLY